MLGGENEHSSTGMGTKTTSSSAGTAEFLRTLVRSSGVEVLAKAPLVLQLLSARAGVQTPERELLERMLLSNAGNVFYSVWQRCDGQIGEEEKAELLEEIQKLGCSAEEACFTADTFLYAVQVNMQLPGLAPGRERSTCPAEAEMDELEDAEEPETGTVVERKSEPKRNANDAKRKRKRFARLMLWTAVSLLIAACVGQIRMNWWRIVPQVVSMGVYEQDGSIENGPEALKWIVLDKTNEAMLVISSHCVALQPFQRNGESVLWKDSTLREWLNGPFLTEAFSAKEQERIIPFSRREGDTQLVDSVFCLSLEEISNLYPDAARVGGQQLQAEPSLQVLAQGAYVDGGNAWWWLRSVEFGNPVCVADTGYLRRSGDEYGGSGATDVAVRPAMWIRNWRIR